MSYESLHHLAVRKYNLGHGLLRRGHRYWESFSQPCDAEYAFTDGITVICNTIICSGDLTSERYDGHLWNQDRFCLEQLYLTRPGPSGKETMVQTRPAATDPPYQRPSASELIIALFCCMCVFGRFAKTRPKNFLIMKQKPPVRRRKQFQVQSLLPSLILQPGME